MTAKENEIDQGLDYAIEEMAINNDLTDQDVLLETRRVKLQLMHALTPDGRMPTDPKEVNALMKVVDSMDRTAQNNIRNSTEQDSNHAVAEALAIIASMQKQVGNRDPFMVDVGTETAEREVFIEETLVETDFVPGELSHETLDLQYEGFVDQFESGGES